MNGWLDDVPIRLADTIGIQDRLPSGSAAVLINQIHTYRDLFLRLGPLEKQMFDAIHGDLSIGGIVETTKSSSGTTKNCDTAGTFFDRWQDQVVVVGLSAASQ